MMPDLYRNVNVMITKRHDTIDRLLDVTTADASSSDTGLRHNFNPAYRDVTRPPDTSDVTHVTALTFMDICDICDIHSAQDGLLYGKHCKIYHHISRDNRNSRRHEWLHQHKPLYQLY